MFFFPSFMALLSEDYWVNGRMRTDFILLAEISRIKQAKAWSSYSYLCAKFQKVLCRWPSHAFFKGSEKANSDDRLYCLQHFDIPSCHIIKHWFFAAAVVCKIVWASWTDWPFSFTQRYCWENSYKSQVLRWGEYLLTSTLILIYKLLLTFDMFTVWGCNWSYSGTVPGPRIWVNL
jgi:hypothetical protein